MLFLETVNAKIYFFGLDEESVPDLKTYKMIFGQKFRL
jgi:hypothetical protein